MITKDVKKNPYSEDLNIKEIKEDTRTWKDLCSMIDRVNTAKKKTTLLLKMTCRFNENSSKIQ